MSKNNSADNSATTANEPVDINELVSRVEKLEQKVDTQPIAF
jgi:tetrahydromethanopterin S-methyltransferase subunit G